MLGSWAFLIILIKNISTICFPIANCFLEELWSFLNEAAWETLQKPVDVGMELFLCHPKFSENKGDVWATGHIGIHEGILWQQFAGMHGMCLWLLDCKIGMSYCSDTFWSTAVKLLEQKQCQVGLMKMMTFQDLHLPLYIQPLIILQNSWLQAVSKFRYATCLVDLEEDCMHCHTALVDPLILITVIWVKILRVLVSFSLHTSI